jgi:DNA-binding beta-propeller fold protein YncE
VVAAVASLLAVLALGSSPAGARQRPPQPEVIVDGLAGPLAIDVKDRGDVLVSQSFGGSIVLVDKHGDVSDPLVEGPVGGVADGPFGTILYTLADPEAGLGELRLRFWNGQSVLFADLAQFEADENPDAVNSYGVQGISPECAAQWPVDELGPAQYDGIVDSNPFKITPTWYGILVADSGGNTINLVDWNGNVSNVAVLPPQPLLLPTDPAALAAIGVPACVAGLTYNFEPVPTDVELGKHGRLIVSLLPGGPEDPSLGARGSVVEITPWNGRIRTLAGGLAGATDVAVSPSGDVYVAELFGDRVSKLTRNGPVTVAELVGPAAVEWAKGRLYVAYEAFGSGKIATLKP